MEARRSNVNLLGVLGIEICIDGSWLVIVGPGWWSLSAGCFPGQRSGLVCTIYLAAQTDAAGRAG